MSIASDAKQYAGQAVEQGKQALNQAVKHALKQALTIVYRTSIAAKTAGSEDWYRSISGRQPYIVP